MQSVLSRLESWLASNAPQLSRHLQPGYSESQLRQIEETFTLQIPRPFREFLAWRQLSGECDVEFELPYAAGWAPFEIFLSHQSYMREMAASDHTPGAASGGWLVFSSIFQHDINALCIDSTAEFGGRQGQVIFYRGWEQTRHVVANSFEDFVEAVVSSMEAGMWSVSEGRLEPRDWDEMDEYLADKLDAPNLSWDLNPEISEEQQRKVVKEVELKSLSIEAYQLLTSRKFDEVISFTEPHLSKPNEPFLHHNWDSLMGSRARALFALGRDDEARALMARLHRHYDEELLAEYWQRVLQGSFEMAPDYQLLLQKTELTLEIVKMAQQAGAISWSFEYPTSSGSFNFQPGQVSWKVDFRFERATAGGALITWGRVIPSSIAGLRHKAVMAIDFGDPSEAGKHFLTACEECKGLGLAEYAARFYNRARTLDPSIPVDSSLEQVPLTAFSEYLNRSLQT